MNSSISTPPPVPAPPRPRPTSGLAVTSLICGILGWTLVPFLGSLLAVVFGHMARAEIRRSPETDGDGMAVTGLVLGYALFVLTILAIIFMVVFFGGFMAFLAAAA